MFLCCKMAPISRKRVSKKNKKSWRKNIDLKDVDNFLEDQRLEERLGVKYSEQKNEDLFQIDTQGKSENTASEHEVPEVSAYRQRKKFGGRSMRLKETEIPKSFQILYKRSAVPAHIISKTSIKQGVSKSKVARTIFKRKLRKELLKAKNKTEKNDCSKKKEPKRGEFTFDVWSKENNERDLDGCAEWLSNDTIRHTLHNTGKTKKQIPKAVLSKTSLLPAVELPHPGLSYNPSLKDHRAILHEVAQSEIKIIEEEKHLDRVTTKMFEKIPRDKLEKEWLKEMTVGLSVIKSESDSEESETEYKAVNPPVKNKKKTLKKRRKLKEALLLKEQLKKQKIEKKKLSDIYKLRKFKDMLDKKEAKILQNIELRKQIKDKKPYMTKVLSQVKYQEPEIDFSLAEDLSGNLRGVKQEGSILHDRFKSLQKRNILQPTLKRHVKKRKVKKYERPHMKMEYELNNYMSKEKKAG